MTSTTRQPDGTGAGQAPPEPGGDALGTTSAAAGS